MRDVMKKRDPSLLLFIACCTLSTACLRFPGRLENGVPGSIFVGVACEADVDRAHALMIEAAQENEHVMDDPSPIVSFEGFGDNSLTLLLRAYIENLDYRLETITGLHRSINHKFKEAGISIAFPQRDLHLNALAPLQVSIVESSKE